VFRKYQSVIQSLYYKVYFAKIKHQKAQCFCNISFSITRVSFKKLLEGSFRGWSGSLPRVTPTDDLLKHLILFDRAIIA